MMRPLTNFHQANVASMSDVLDEGSTQRFLLQEPAQQSDCYNAGGRMWECVH